MQRPKGLRPFGLFVVAEMLDLGGFGRGAPRRGLQQADEVFDADQRRMQQARVELAAEGCDHLAHGLLDVFGIQAKVLVEMIAGEDGKLDSLDLLQVAIGGSSDGGIETIALEVSRKGGFRDAFALTCQGLMATLCGDFENEKCCNDQDRDDTQRPCLLFQPD